MIIIADCFQILFLIFFHYRDGASVNMGVDKGVGVRMIRALGRSIVVHHCAGTLLFEDLLIQGFLLPNFFLNSPPKRVDLQAFHEELQSILGN